MGSNHVSRTSTRFPAAKLRRSGTLARRPAVSVRAATTSASAGSWSSCNGLVARRSSARFPAAKLRRSGTLARRPAVSVRAATTSASAGSWSSCNGLVARRSSARFPAAKLRRSGTLARRPAVSVRAATTSASAGSWSSCNGLVARRSFTRFPAAKLQRYGTPARRPAVSVRAATTSASEGNSKNLPGSNRVAYRFRQTCQQTLDESPRLPGSYSPGRGVLLASHPVRYYPNAFPPVAPVATSAPPVIATPAIVASVQTPPTKQPSATTARTRESAEITRILGPLGIVVILVLVLLYFGRGGKRLSICSNCKAITITDGNPCLKCQREDSRRQAELEATLRRRQAELEATERVRQEKERRQRELDLRRQEFARNIRSLSFLQQLEPMTFQRLIWLAYERSGYAVTETPAGRDGGVDGFLKKDGHLYVLQCKRYRFDVGEPIVRDLFGTLHHHHAQGAILVTTGTISRPAKEFSEGKSIELVDGKALLALLDATEITAGLVPDSFVSNHTPRALQEQKICPKCGGELRRRKSRRGRPFIGCSNYPTCRYTAQVATPLRF